MRINILVTDSLLDGLQVKGYVFLDRAVYTMFHHTHLPLLSYIDSINRENNTSYFLTQSPAQWMTYMIITLILN